MNNPLSPEAELFSDCDRQSVTVSEQQQTHHLLSQIEDWPRLRRLAGSAHGLFALVAQKVLAFETAPLPPDERKIWSSQLRSCLIRGLSSLELLSHLSAQFRSHGIPAVCWKGPLQSLRLYGEPGLRQFCDLDLFVRSHQVGAACEVLRTLGFEPDRPLRTDSFSTLLRIDSEYPWKNPQSGAVVDLQWQVRAQPLFLNPENLGSWERLETTSVGGRQFLIWSWPDEILFLALHGAKHRWSSWEWVLSFARTLERGQPEQWHTLEKLSADSGHTRLLQLGIAVARELIGLTLPEYSITCLRDDRSLQKMAHERVSSLRESTRGATASRLLPAWLDYLWLADSPSVAWRDLARWLIRPSVRDLEAFPHVPLIGLYGLRPLRLFYQKLVKRR